MKILYVINSLETGGAEKVVVDLLNGLNADSFEPSLCCIQEKGPLYGAIERKGIEVIEFRHYRGNNPGLPIRIAQFVRDRGIGMIHSHGWGPFCEAVAAARLGNTLMVHTAHGRRSGELGSRLARAKRKIRHKTEALLMRWVDRLVVVSEYQREELIREMGLRPEKVVSIANGISIPSSSVHRVKKRKEMGFSEDQLVILSVGRLDKIKNYPVLLESAGGVIREFPQARFLIAGDGPQRSELNDLCSRRGLESYVRLLGHCDNVPELLSIADLFVLPSDFEATSVALLEAMASGLPVVATRVGGNPFVVVDGETGILVPPRDAVGLAKTIVSLLRDPKLRTVIGDKGIQRVRQYYTREKMLDSYQQLYRELLKEQVLPRCREKAWV